MRGNFRVWDNKNKRYDYGDFFITTDGELLKDVGSYSVEVWRCEYNEPGRYIAEFYTGLKDVNGDEICEGDIVKWFGYEVKSGRQVRPERTMCINDYVKDTYRIFCITDNAGQTVEIIGDIHENPELLENS